MKTTKDVRAKIGYIQHPQNGLIADLLDDFATLKEENAKMEEECGYLWQRKHELDALKHKHEKFRAWLAVMVKKQPAMIIVMDEFNEKFGEER